MRRAEITLMTILYVIASFFVSVYTDKELGITEGIEKSFNEDNQTVEKEYKKIIITDK